MAAREVQVEPVLPELLRQLLVALLAWRQVALLPAWQRWARLDGPGPERLLPFAV